MNIVSETTIITLQAIAALLMGYEYFFSVRFRDYLDSKIRLALMNTDQDCKNEIKKQIDIIWKNFGYIPATLFFAISTVAIYFSLKLFVVPGFNILVLILALLSMLFCGYCALLGLGKILEITLPLAVPSFLKAVVAFLLNCPKGIIAGIGMLFLIASFVCRYINAVNL